MVFHPDKPLAYLINELSNTVLVFERNMQTGGLSQIQRLSSLPASFKEHSQAAAIELSPDSRFLYVSNRGANSIAVFKLDENGKLTYIQDQSTGGDWPRDFVISEDGQFLLVANQRSNNISALNRDSQTGLLAPATEFFEVSQPTFIGQL
jgi:6-phosphogluconolactonase